MVRVAISPYQLVAGLSQQALTSLNHSGKIDPFSVKSDYSNRVCAAPWGIGSICGDADTLESGTFILASRKIVGFNSRIFHDCAVLDEIRRRGKSELRSCLPVNDLDDLLRREITSYLHLATTELGLRFPLVIVVDILGVDGLYVVKIGDTGLKSIGGPGPIPRFKKDLSVHLPIFSMTDWETPNDMLYAIRQEIYDAGAASGNPLPTWF